METEIKTLGFPLDVLNPSPHNLDREFEAHPEHIATAAEAVASARVNLKLCELARDRVFGRVTREKIDDAPGKLTVKEIDAEIAQDSECRKAEGGVIDAAFKLEVLGGLLTALQAKTSALKHLSELWQAGYYTTTSSKPPPRRRPHTDE